MWFFEYDVKFFDDDYGLVKAKGITVGETLNEACMRVIHWYGEKSIASITIKEMKDCEEGGILEETRVELEAAK